LRMSKDVVPIERLLHHEQFEIVESCKVFCVVEPVRGIRIHREKDLRELRADRLHKVVVFSRLDLQFDSLVSAAEFLLDLCHQGVWALANAKRDATVNLLLYTAKKTRKGKAGELGFCVPKGIFDAAFGHFLAPNTGDEFRKFGRAFDFLALQKGRDKI